MRPLQQGQKRRIWYPYNDPYNDFQMQFVQTTVSTGGENFTTIHLLGKIGIATVLEGVGSQFGGPILNQIRR